MFASVLVANRAEIACRIFRTARAMGLRTIAVYSDADAKAKHVREADQAAHIGAAPAAESYLRGDKIIAAAKDTGAEAIHPGYGFLSENPDFAQAVIDAGLIWIGPTPGAIRAMGLKDEAKRIAEEAGVPVVPGYRGAAQDAKTLAKAAKDVGFPVLIKAVAGGGGRGIREVNAAEDFAAALESAKREALAAFGDDRVIVEKLIQRPRHIEVQVFGDKHGGLVHLFERDCSLQRRRQKVIEEAPAPGMTDEVRAAMTDAALKVARAVNYENAGTVEYVVDGTGALRADGFWFLEMNTRLQVEHPVTEAVTGLDLVEWQFRVAAGERLPRTQHEIALDGCAIEARICAEDPSESFRPSVGKITRYAIGAVARLDAGFDAGDAVPAAYDSLIGKAVTSSYDRGAAIFDLAHALETGAIEGVRTNMGFLVRCLRARAFEDGDVHTGFIAEAGEALTRTDLFDTLAAAALHVASAVGSGDPWAARDGWRLNGGGAVSFAYETADAAHRITLTPLAAAGAAMLAARSGIRQALGGWRVDSGQAIGEFCVVERAEGFITLANDAGVWTADVTREGAGVRVRARGESHVLLALGASREHADGAASDEVKAPLPGKVVAVAVKAGASVKKGEALVTLEAMKMEHQLKAPRDGVIAEIAAEEGAQVKEGALLVRLAPLEDGA